MQSGSCQPSGAINRRLRSSLCRPGCDLAHAMIKKAFDENGIKFAFPTVQIASEGEPATAAVAQHALKLAHPVAAR